VVCEVILDYYGFRRVVYADNDLLRIDYHVYESTYLVSDLKSVKWVFVKTDTPNVYVYSHKES